MAVAPRRVDRELCRRIQRLAGQGKSQREIAAEIGMHQKTVWRVLAPWGGTWRGDVPLEVPAGCLSLEDRVAIRIGLEVGKSCTAIARELGYAPSTVTREVSRNGGRSYQPVRAHRRAWERSRRPKATKLASNPALCQQVIEGLKELWSPEQIARRLRERFPDDPDMWVSHETIYKSLYVQGRGELRRELARCLRSGRAQRRPHGRERRGKLTDMVMISERPAEVADRAVPGHWEGDLILGKNNRSAIGTLVERTTRFVLLLHLPHGKSAEHVREAMTATIQTLPVALRRSLTWDQGKEMAEHVQFRVDTGMDVYFCDPHSPWQRGTNENTNGLLRQYFPKGTDLSRHDAATLQRAADSLNGRPRKTLGWKNPAEALAELIASTD